jgi:aspartate racemase
VLSDLSPGRPTLGVLGGMGPAATADFLARLARLTPATCDQDHVPTIVYSDPQTPDRSDAILGLGPSPLPAMLKGVNFLNHSGCALIAVPCNSAHYWHEELARHSTVPVLHIADATAERLREGGGSPVGLLATDGTVRAGIYRDRLHSAGIDTLDLTDLADANPVMRGIRALKGGQVSLARQTLQAAGEELVRRGATTLILGCTDVSVALAGVTNVAGAAVIDASDCLARACIVKLGGHPG